MPSSRWLLTPFVSVFNAMAECTYGAPNRGVSPPARSDGIVTGDDWDTVSQESEGYEIPPFSRDGFNSDVYGRLQYAISVYNRSEVPHHGTSSDEEMTGSAPEWTKNGTYSESPSAGPAFRLDTTLGRRNHRIQRRSRCGSKPQASGANGSRRFSRRWRPTSDQRVQLYTRDSRNTGDLKASYHPLNPTDDRIDTTEATRNPSSKDARGTSDGCRGPSRALLRSKITASIGPPTASRQTCSLAPADVWRANAGLPLRPTKPNDWSALQRQLLEWNVPQFSGGAATSRPLLAARLGPRAVFQGRDAEGTGFALYADVRSDSLKVAPDTFRHSNGVLDTSSYLSSNSDEVLSPRRDRSFHEIGHRDRRVQPRKSEATGGSDLTAADADSSSDVGDEDAILRTYTPRQRRLHASLYPPKRCFDAGLTETAWSSTLKTQLFQGLTPQEEQRALTKMFKTFVVELTRGAYFTQLAGRHQYFTLHCQLTETLESLTIDPNSGERIEFPLRDVVRVFRVNRSVPHQSASPCGDAQASSSPEPASKHKGINHSSRHPPSIPPLDLTALVAQPDLLVIVQFKTRKRLAFVFKDPVEADQFCLCLELLVEHVREKNSATLSWFGLTKRRDRQMRAQQSNTALQERRFATARLRDGRSCSSFSCRCCCHRQPCSVSRRRCCCYWTENFMPVGSVVKNGWTATPASSSFGSAFSEDSDSAFSKGSDVSYLSGSPPEVGDRKSTKGGVLSSKPSILSLSSSDISLHSGGTTVPPSTPRSKNMEVITSVAPDGMVLPSKSKASPRSVPHPHLEPQWSSHCEVSGLLYTAAHVATKQDKPGYAHSLSYNTDGGCRASSRQRSKPCPTPL